MSAPGKLKAIAPGDCISVQEAAPEYQIGMTTLFKYLNLKRLTRYGREMDRRTFLDRAEIERLLLSVQEEARPRSNG